MSAETEQEAPLDISAAYAESNIGAIVEQLDPHRAPGRLHRGVVVAVAGSDQGACGWIVSPRASISTNWSMRLERVSGFLAFPIL